MTRQDTAADWSGSIDVRSPVSVVFGEGIAAATVTERLNELAAKRVLVVTDPAVRCTEAFDVVRRAVGDRLAGTFSNARAHLPREVVIEGVEAFRSAGADAVLTLGGGSCTDAGKAVRLAAVLGIKSVGDFDHITPDALLEAGRSTAHQIALPTTLAGAEFTDVAGVTDLARVEKQVLGGPGFAARVAVLDPALTAETPDDIWACGALKVLSDAIEMLTLPDLNPAVAPLAERAITLISGELRGGDLATPQSRLTLQLATWMGTFTLVQSHSKLGLATALRHVCGPGLGAPHAAIAAVFLPHAYRFNGPFILDERQQAIAHALGLDRPGPDGSAIADRLGELTSALVQGLRDFGVDREQFLRLAAVVAGESNRTTNPRRDIAAAEIEQLLETSY
jgi:maleylacetate reductase